MVRGAVEARGGGGGDRGDLARRAGAGVARAREQRRDERGRVDGGEELLGEGAEARIGRAALGRRRGELGEEALVGGAEHVGRRGRVLPHRLDARAAIEADGHLAGRRRDEEDGGALATRAAGAPAAVREALGVSRWIRVDHTVDFGHVETTRGHIGRHEGGDVAGAEGVEDAGALALLELAAQGARAEAGRAEAIGQIGRVGAGADEDERALAGGEEEEVDEGGLALLRADEEGEVLDVLVGGAEAGAFDPRRVGLVAVGEGEHLAREGRGDEVRAALGRGLFEDGLELVAEAEIEHLIGLVEDHRLGRAGVDGAALEVVEQAAGRADDDERALAQGAQLEGVAGAAGDTGDAHADGLEEPRELAGELRGELARGRDEQGRGARGDRLGRQVRGHVLARVRGLGGARLGDAGEHGRQDEADGHGLSRARLRRDAEIAPFEGRVEDGFLDGGEGGKSAGFEGQRDGRREGFEGGGWHESGVS
jgi:hypothetical protein